MHEGRTQTRQTTPSQNATQVKPAPVFRRDQLRHPSYVAPQLLATAPNQLWSWDITKLLGPTKWTYFYLYMILDVFSRYVVPTLVRLSPFQRSAGCTIATSGGWQRKILQMGFSGATTGPGSCAPALRPVTAAGGPPRHFLI